MSYRMVLIADFRGKVIGQVGTTEMLDQPITLLVDEPVDRDKLRDAFRACCDTDSAQSVTIWRDSRKREQFIIHLACLPACVMVVVERYTRSTNGEELKSKHIRLLALLAGDKTPHEIMQTLKLTPSAMRQRIMLLRHKFSCSTTHGMVAKALRDGILE